MRARARERKRDCALHGSLLVDFMGRGNAVLKFKMNHAAASIAEMQGAFRFGRLGRAGIWLGRKQTRPRKKCAAKPKVGKTGGWAIATDGRCPVGLKFGRRDRRCDDLDGRHFASSLVAFRRDRLRAHRLMTVRADLMISAARSRYAARWSHHRRTGEKQSNAQGDELGDPSHSRTVIIGPPSRGFGDLGHVRSLAKSIR